MKIIIGMLVVLVIISLGTAGYFIFQNQKLIDNFSNSNPSPAASPIAYPSDNLTTSSPSPISFTLEKVTSVIENSVNSTSFNDLSEYLLDNVSVVLMSTECCGVLTKKEAIDQMSYITAGIPFNFDQNTNIVQNLKANNNQLENTYIGISIAEEQLIAFTLNENHVISSIQMSISHKLYNQ